MHNKILYSWNSIALNPEEASSEKFLDLSSLTIEDALSVVYPALSFCELVETLKKLKTSALICENLNQALVFTNYGFSLDSKLTRLLEVLPYMPAVFWNWCCKHSLSPRDLTPLLSVQSPQQLSLSLDSFNELQLSRNLGAQIIELLVECFLMDNADADLFTLSQNSPASKTSGDHWLQNLKTRRFPQTAKADSEKQKTLLSLPWTKDLQTRWLRQGDRSGVEVRFFAANPKELQKHVDQLQKIVKVEKVFHDTP